MNTTQSQIGELVNREMNFDQQIYAFCKQFIANLAADRNEGKTVAMHTTASFLYYFSKNQIKLTQIQNASIKGSFQECKYLSIQMDFHQQIQKISFKFSQEFPTLNLWLSANIYNRWMKPISCSTYVIIIINNDANSSQYRGKFYQSSLHKFTNTIPQVCKIYSAPKIHNQPHVDFETKSDESKRKVTCTALPPSRHPTGSILKADVVKPHLQKLLVW